MQISNFHRLRQCFGILSGLFLAAFLFAMVATPSTTASAQVVLSVSIAPPALPVYTQPICPGEGYIWTPGYWSYSDDGGYFWVPGTWVEAPEVGFLWTPGYWGWSDGAYIWNAGYWGPQIGFYGGIDYGFGYIGTGYAGGYWQGGQFFYNSRVNNVNVTVIHNVYQKTVVEHGNHVSFNGGHGGISARPTAAQETFAHEHHTPATATQREHETAARGDHNQFASVNHGHPAVAATARPGEFKGTGVVAARGAASHPATAKGTEARTSAARSEKAPRTASNNKARTEGKSAAREHKSAEAKPAHEPKPSVKARTERAESTPRSENKPAESEAKAAQKSAQAERKSQAKTEQKSAQAEQKSQAKAEQKSAQAEQKSAEKAQQKSAQAEQKSEAKAEQKSRTEAKAGPKPTVHESKPSAAHESKPPAAHESKAPAQHESAPREEKKPPKS